MSDVRFTAKMKGGSDVARLLNRYPEKVGRTMESLVKQEARGLAVELARNTRPFGFSEKAKKLGERAVAKDISGVFALPSAAFEEIRKSDPGAADRFWSNIQNRRFSRAETALRSSSSGWKDLTVGRLDPKLHKWGQLGGDKPKQIVTSSKALDTYIAKIQKRVMGVSPENRVFLMGVSPENRVFLLMAAIGSLFGWNPDLVVMGVSPEWRGVKRIFDSGYGGRSR